MEESGRPIPIALRYRGIRVDRAGLRALIAHCLEAERGPAARGCGLILAGGRLLQTLNRQWRGLDRTTDVLSFPLDGPGAAATPEATLPEGLEDPDAYLLGEVVISVPRLLDQAKAAGIKPGEELVRLVIHGVLHVLGHDHEIAGERVRMQGRERALRRWAAARGIGPGLLRVRT
jgi:probable rRNA maturation factor